MLIQNDTSISYSLHRDGHSMYRCPYLTFEQQLTTTYRSFEQCTAADARTRRLLMQETQEVDLSPYAACLRQARSTARSLTENPRKKKTPNFRQSGLWTKFRRRGLPFSPYLPRTEAKNAPRYPTLPDHRSFCELFRKAMLLMKTALTDEEPCTAEKSQTTQNDAAHYYSNTYEDPESE